MKYDIVIIGSGIFGITAALELHKRGYSVAVCSSGVIPDPLAASTDISKVIRFDYGFDQDYFELGIEAVKGWHEWNTSLGEEIYFETGVSFLASASLQPGGYEHDSLHLLKERGLPVTLLDDGMKNLPAWNRDKYPYGYINHQAGWARSGRVVELLTEQARDQGITILEQTRILQLKIDNQRITGVETDSQSLVEADHVIVAAGAWTPVLLPELADAMWTTGHPVFHLKPDNPDHFTSPNFLVFTADISNTGWYGFSYHPIEKVVKIANHGPGIRLNPDTDERVVTSEHEKQLRDFVKSSLPELATAEIVYTRLCLYCDTFDGDFWISQHPQVKGLTVAAGGSGHGFKFGPVLGTLIADEVEGKDYFLRSKFAWRDNPHQANEAARFTG